MSESELVVAPDVTVVIPYGGRNPVLLGRQLAAVAGSGYQGHVEILVADNRGTADGMELPPGVRLVDASGRRGPSFARNVGWRFAETDLIAFCDADDVVGPGWVAALVRASRRYDLVGGALDHAVLNAPAVRWWNRQTTTALPVKWGHKAFAPSCNLLVRRDVLHALGGFAEDLTIGEDIDFSWRAQEQGYALGFAPDAVVHYRHREDARTIARHAFAYGLSDAELTQRHGVRAPAREWIRELASLLRTIAQAATRRGGHLKLAHRAATIAGSLVGYARAARVRRRA